MVLESLFIPLTLFRMGIFGAAHGWGQGGGKKAPLPKICHNLAQLYLTQKRFKKYINHVTHPLSSADISIFTGNQQILLYQEIQI